MTLPDLRRGVFSLMLAATIAAPALADQVGLADLGTDAVEQDFGQARANKSVGGNPLSVGGHAFTYGLGTHAESVLRLDLHGVATRLTAQVGMDDEVKAEPSRLDIAFEVDGDGKTLFQSNPLKVGDAPQAVDVDLKGIKALVLKVTSPSGRVTSCHADWAEAMIVYDGVRPTPAGAPPEVAEVLTPPAPATPRINSAAVLGVRPGHPVLYLVAATGDRPMHFTADGLPPGVALDADSGRLTGSVDNAGTYSVRLHATNAKGTADKDLSLVVGQRVALTPPMGWNSWNCFAGNVSQDKVAAAAEAMVTSGLVNYGWTYINIDDCWQVRANRPAADRRAPDGHVLTNERFPDMKALAELIHAKGLRAGLYSSPGPATCGGYTGSYEHEVDDARQYAAWGFDYLKYDWCSYGGIAKQRKPNFDGGRDIDEDRRPYDVMRDALAAQDRDIVYSLCQYGMGDVWNWGDAAGGNCWRTTGDIVDQWKSMAGIGFAQSPHAPFAGPGHWNDPDMLVVGKVGWGPNPRPSRLTPSEQYTHMTLWSMLSAPLLIGCDLTQLDPFTFGLLSNSEVIAIDQDPLGRQATRVWQSPDHLEAWAKPLADGSTAVALFNRAETPMPVNVKWADLGVTMPAAVRDLWRQHDLPTPTDTLSATLSRHGCVLYKLMPAKG